MALPIVAHTGSSADVSEVQPPNVPAVSSHAGSSTDVSAVQPSNALLAYVHAGKSTETSEVQFWNASNLTVVHFGRLIAVSFAFLNA